MTELPSAVDAPTGQARRCEYSQCRVVLPNREGRGPKLRYCRGRGWGEDNRTCREMAAAERAARRAAAGDAPLDALVALSERIEQAGAPLAELYAQIQDTLDEATATAVRTAKEAGLHAAAEAERAEQATAEANRAAEAQRQAEAARERAVAQAQEAERRATAARREADEQVRTATDRLAAAERERGHAQASAAGETRRREEAERTAAEAQAEAEELREQLRAVRETHAELRTQLAGLVGRAERAEADNTRLREQVDDLIARMAIADRDRQAAREHADAELRATELQRDAAREEATRLRQEHAAAQAGAAAARADAQAHAQRLATADARVDQLLTLLAAAGPAGEPVVGEMGEPVTSGL